MPLTLLQMVNAAQAELGLPQSTAVFGSGADATGVQMGSLANRTLDELRRVTRWSAMQFEMDLAVNPATTVTGDLIAASPYTISNILPDTSGLAANFFQVSGPSIPSAARIASVDSASQITMDMQQTNAVNVLGATILFAQDTYPLPSGFDWFNNRTMWDRTNRWELLGPDSPQMDQWHRSGIVVTGPRRHFRQIGPFADQFRLWPPPFEIVTPAQLVFEYLSLDAVSVHGSISNFAQYFANDNDKCLLDDNAVIMGIKWMFWEAKGFGSYVTMQSRWVDYVDRLIARDGAAATLSIVKRVNPIFLSPANVQDGFFPGPVGPNAA